jgi:integrase
MSNMTMLMLLRRMKRDDLTVHRFRSTFSDWAAGRTAYPREVVEISLAHAIGNKWKLPIAAPICSRSGTG